MTIIITVILTIIMISGLFYLLIRLKTPYYRVDKARMMTVLERVLTGQATDNDWQMTFGMVIRHSPNLEELRQRCVEIEEAHYIGNQRPPYLFSSAGLEHLQQVLQEMRKAP